jgi:hypothetical protein
VGYSRYARTAFLPHKNKSQKSAKNPPLKNLYSATTFSPQTCHVYHTKNHVLHPIFRKNPCKNPTPPRRKNGTKNDGPGTVFAVPGPPDLQTARKPNSVLDDHSSRRHITESLQQPTRRFWPPANRVSPPSRIGPIRFLPPGEERQNPCLFGLAPCGVYPAATITGRAVRSYRTFSPLPKAAYMNHLRGPSAKGGIFSVALAVQMA